MNTTIFAVDPGFGETKINVDGKSASLTSAIARLKQIGMAGIGMKTASKAMNIQMGWETYAIGDGAWNWGEVLTNRDYSALSSPERRALVFGTLSTILDPGTHEFDTMVIGLPVPLLLDETQSQTIMGGLKAYKGTHQFNTDKGTYNLTINKLKALAQPVGAYADWLLDDELHIRKNGRQAEVAVLDIGMNTLDMFVVQDANILPRFIGGDKVGVRRLLEILNTNGHEPEELDAQMRSGRLRPSKDQLESWLSEPCIDLQRRSRFMARKSQPHQCARLVEVGRVWPLSSARRAHWS
jgi:hypothetical protein